MNFRYTVSLGAALAAAPYSAQAAELSLKLEIPRLAVAEYHTPYVAVWLQRASDQGFAGHLAVWYDLKKKDNAGAKWLRDLRQWWRQGGRDAQMPMDGVSGATRAPGEHLVQLGGAKALATLPAGDYEVVVEAAREGGGREVLRLPLRWPMAGVAQAKAQGEHELGAISLQGKP
ncbi:DUF2271 domain-containing protein [Ideonella sp. DXS29W]|uniref:DUF2271 domain-containing protein n=1 Tax=Ideonella lacteola TaxID=2984193 RepID=A0ABU9BJ65_9BURK